MQSGRFERGRRRAAFGPTTTTTTAEPDDAFYLIRSEVEVGHSWFESAPIPLAHWEQVVLQGPAASAQAHALALEWVNGGL